jgi:hypothetical protein
LVATCPSVREDGKRERDLDGCGHGVEAEGRVNEKGNNRRYGVRFLFFRPQARPKTMDHRFVPDLDFFLSPTERRNVDHRGMPSVTSSGCKA